jgi:hypothetical protein
LFLKLRADGWIRNGGSCWMPIGQRPLEAARSIF